MCFSYSAMTQLAAQKAHEAGYLPVAKAALLQAYKSLSSDETTAPGETAAVLRVLISITAKGATNYSMTGPLKGITAHKQVSSWFVVVHLALEPYNKAK